LERRGPFAPIKENTSCLLGRLKRALGEAGASFTKEPDLNDRTFKSTPESRWQAGIQALCFSSSSSL